MANVITLPNGITIESSDPVAQQNEDLVISREAYAVLENFSAESIYEAADFIMSQEAEALIDRNRDLQSQLDAFSNSPERQAERLRAQNITTKARGGLAASRSETRAAGIRGGAAARSGLTMVKDGSSKAAASAAKGGLGAWAKAHPVKAAAAATGIAAGLTAGGLYLKKRHDAKKRAAVAAAEGTESFVLPSGQTVHVV